MSSIVRPAPFCGPPAVQVHLLGQVDFALCEALQQRLVYEASGRDDGQITLLLCEHDGLISVGRQGSRAHIRFSPRALESHRLDVQWINRGGGCVLHQPGQLAIYPIVPLACHGWTVGEYLSRLQQAIVDCLLELGIPAQTRAGQHGVWGRGGQLAMLGVSVKNWVAYHGAFLNVSPSMYLTRWIKTDPGQDSPAACLVAERHQLVKMTRVRESLIRHLISAFDGDRYHVYSGHPLWAQCREPRRKPAQRVG